MYGTQTLELIAIALDVFENDVKMYGTQTSVKRNTVATQFENDVKMYGTQTFPKAAAPKSGLRMM